MARSAGHLPRKAQSQEANQPKEDQEPGGGGLG